jgi:hypothetical protein
MSMMPMVKMMAAVMVGSGKYRSSNRYAHHSKKGDGDLPHVPFISWRFEKWQDTF